MAVRVLRGLQLRRITELVTATVFSDDVTCCTLAECHTGIKCTLNRCGMVVKVKIKLHSSIKYGSLPNVTEVTCYGSHAEKGLSMITLFVYIGGIYSFNNHA